jgi:glucose-6-phosphate 1-epimerase
MSPFESPVRHGVNLPSTVRVEQGAGGLPRLAIAGSHGTAALYFQGAHLTAWHPANAAAPVLWLSRESRFEPGKAIRGGVPICLPWVGANASDPAAPAHGFARLRDWTLIDANEDVHGVITLTMELSSAPPHVFTAQYRVTFGDSLTMELSVHNPGSVPFIFEEALHTYFAVGNIHTVAVSGTEDTDYLDKVAGFARRRQSDAPIAFTGETDRVYLNTHTTCLIHDPDLRRTIAIRKSGSDTTVIWNPWIDKAKAMPDFGDVEWTQMVCVETCNVNVHAKTLQPGERHSMTATLAVTALA